MRLYTAKSPAPGCLLRNQVLKFKTIQRKGIANDRGEKTMSTPT